MITDSRETEQWRRKGNKNESDDDKDGSKRSEGNESIVRSSSRQNEREIKGDCRLDFVVDWHGASRNEEPEVLDGGGEQVCAATNHSSNSPLLVITTATGDD